MTAGSGLVGMQRVVGLTLGACAALALLGSQATVASAEVGGAYSWGRNESGELGNGAMADGFAATPISLTGAISVVGRSEGGAALLIDGTVMTWGSNESGELGNGTTEASDTPTPVTGLSEVVAISARGRFCLALLSNGTVMAWGKNALGELGDGTTENKDVPVPVSGLEHVSAISAGVVHSLALLSSGEVMAWGGNAEGQLGNGTKEGSLVPIPVPGLSEVRAISASAQNLALSSEGGVWAWGPNASGQLGNGGTTESDVPIPVPGLSSGFTAVAAGGGFSLALRENGSIMSWGSDTFGELGDGTHGKEANKTSPVNVKGITEATAISAGAFQSMARLANGTAMAWGGNEVGELGIGSAVNEGAGDVPVVVCGLHEVGGVAAGVLANYAFNVGSAPQLCPFVRQVPNPLGGEQGGDAVTVIGGNFVGTTAVKFGANSSPKFTVNSSTSLTAISPPGTGEVEVTVVNPEGKSGPSPVFIHNFHYTSPPVLHSVTPAKGPANGGATVNISGEGFVNVTAVKFGSLPATSFEVGALKGRQRVVKAVSPAEPAGTVAITVTARYGTTLGNVHDRYTFLPVVSSVTPNSGSHVGGTNVTVTGAGFLPGKTATTFKFGTAKATSVNCASTTECTMLAPAHVAGVVDVVATANKVPSAKTPPTDGFTYE